MIKQAIKTRRIRVTRQDIEKAREELSNQPKPIKPKAEREKPRYGKDSWYGLVYCDSNGYASIVGDNLEGVQLGKTDEVIPYLKSRRIDGENVDMVLQAIKEFQSEFESQSYHLAMKSHATPISTPPASPNRITFKGDPRFLASLNEFIAKGYGIPTIQRELKAKGYKVAYATLGRWVKERRDTKEA